MRESAKLKIGRYDTELIKYFVQVKLRSNTVLVDSTIQENLMTKEKQLAKVKQ